MGRSPCCSKVGLKRGPWSIEEDNLLTNYIQQNGEGQWRSLPKNAGLLRCGKSCRLRWMNYLRPGIVRGNITQDEEDLIVRLHGLLGNRWSLIAGRLPGRTDNEVKNYWNTHLLKKLNEAGVNPKPRRDLPKKTKKTAAVDGGGKGKGKGKNKNKNKKKKKKNKQNENETKDNTDTNNVALSSSKNSINGSASVDEKVDITPRTKVYLPKPIRVSSVFSRTSSYESLGSRTMSSSDGGGAEKAAEVAWPPKFEVGEEDGYFAACGGGDDDFLGCDDGYNNMGLMIGSHHLDSMPGDVIMWEQVYDEYLQLL